MYTYLYEEKVVKPMGTINNMSRTKEVIIWRDNG